MCLGVYDRSMYACLSMCVTAGLLLMSANAQRSELCSVGRVNTGEMECRCSGEKQHFELDFDEIRDLRNINKFTLENCKSSYLHSKTFDFSHRLTEIFIKSVTNLTFAARLPSTLQLLEMKDIGFVVDITRFSFSAVTNMTYLLVEDATIGRIETDTFATIPVMYQISFYNVMFLNLPGGALALNFKQGMIGDPHLIFDSCTFVKINAEPLSISTRDLLNMDVQFTNNVFDCKSVAKVYYQLSHLLREDIVKNAGVHCDFLENNYCGTNRTTENRLSFQLFKSKRMSTRVGLQLDLVCPQLYQEYERFVVVKNSAHRLYVQISFISFVIILRYLHCTKIVH